MFLFLVILPDSSHRWPFFLKTIICTNIRTSPWFSNVSVWLLPAAIVLISTHEAQISQSCFQLNKTANTWPVCGEHHLRCGLWFWSLQRRNSARFFKIWRWDVRRLEVQTASAASQTSESNVTHRHKDCKVSQCVTVTNFRGRKHLQKICRPELLTFRRL